MKTLEIENELSFNFNRTFDKSELSILIGWFVMNFGSLRTKPLLDELKNFSLTYATLSGVSLGLEDLQIPPSKVDMVKNADNILKGILRRCRNSKLYFAEILERENEIWSITSENLKNEVLNNLRKIDLLNPLYVMTISGARGNLSQVKQLVGMRGWMSDTQGNLINLPIKSNFKEGLNIVEYFISCYGARKGLIDTALKTANAGYLTRRLVYAAQGIVIKKSDCLTPLKTIVIIKEKEKQDYKALRSKLLGRIIVGTIKCENSDKILFSSGQDICNVRLELVKF